MSELKLEREDLLKQVKTLKNQIVDVEILAKSKYDSNKPIEIQTSVEQLKRNIFNLDIFLNDGLV